MLSAVPGTLRGLPTGKVTTAMAAEALERSERYVRYKVASGELPAERYPLGALIDERDLVAFATQQARRRLERRIRRTGPSAA
jgi:hypothetical protein